MVTDNKIEKPDIQYADLFWLFILGSLLGVPLEGLFCLVRYGHWETHVVTIWGPFCALYGLGAVGFYVGGVYLADRKLFTRFLVFAFVGTAIELLSGLLLEYGLNMYAWDYSEHSFNFHGYSSLQMDIVWGVVGVAAAQGAPYLYRLIITHHNDRANAFAKLLTVFLVIDVIFTAICVYRWSQRHVGAPASNAFFQWIDTRYDDSFMSQRFCEWRFLDER